MQGCPPRRRPVDSEEAGHPKLYGPQKIIPGSQFDYADFCAKSLASQSSQETARRNEVSNAALAHIAARLAAVEFKLPGADGLRGKLHLAPAQSRELARVAIEAMRDIPKLAYDDYRCEKCWGELNSTEVLELWIGAALKEYRKCKTAWRYERPATRRPK